MKESPEYSQMNNNETHSGQNAAGKGRIFLVVVAALIALASAFFAGAGVSFKKMQSSGADVPTEAETTEAVTEELSFSDVFGDRSFQFGTKNFAQCSGDFIINPDLSFTYSYSDKNAKSFFIAENTGTLGNFKKISDYIYCLSITEFNEDPRADESYTSVDEWYGEMDYYVIEKGDLDRCSDIYIIMPNSPVSALPSGFCDYIEGVFNTKIIDGRLPDRYYMFDPGSRAAYVEILEK